MIRQETPTQWLLVTHADHAAIAGQFADYWGGADFDRPGPYESIRYSIYHHDDGWIARDSAPVLTSDNRPEAFTSRLVGAYSAFEEIDLPAYLRVRAAATEAVASVDKAAGVFVSMHTHNLLSEQADLSTIRPEHRPAHAEFLKAQLSWQQAAAASLGLSNQTCKRAFEFLQCCDNLSLMVCSGYDLPRDLRHTHPDKNGTHHTIRCTWVSPELYTLNPWPCAVSEVVLRIPYRSIAKAECISDATLKNAWEKAVLRTHTLVLRPA